MTTLVDTPEEVSELAGNGDSVGLGGFILYRKPMALVRALIRRRVSDLNLIAPIGSIDVDLLIRAGLVREVMFAFCNFDVLGAAPNFRRRIEAGEVKSDERGTLAIMRGLEAAQRDLPEMPARSSIGSDLMSSLPAVTMPSRGLPNYVLVPAVSPDVTFIHAQAADSDGNLLIANEGFDFDLIKASKRVGATVEQIVTSKELEVMRGVFVEHTEVDALTLAPMGAHPTSCFPHYSQDVEYLLDFLDAADESVQDMERWVESDEAAYRDSVGSERTTRLCRNMARGRAFHEVGGRHEGSFA